MLAFVATPSAAQTWTGVASGSWANAANWSPAGIPLSRPDRQLTFGAAETTAMTNDIAGPFAFNQLIFNAGDPAYTLTGNDLSALTNSGNVPASIVTNSSNAVTVSNNIALTNPLAVSGTGAGSISLNGVIAGSGGVTYSAPGTLTLGNAANTYSGGTNVLNGTVQVASDAALGTGNVTRAGTGTPGSNYVSPPDTLGGGAGQLHLYRLYGDANGDGIVEQLDLGQFRAANNTTSPDPAYLAFLDANNDTHIDQIDLGQFRTRNNTSVF